MNKKLLVGSAIVTVSLAFQNCGKFDSTAPQSAEGSSSGAVFSGNRGNDNTFPGGNNTGGNSAVAQLSLRFAGVDNINWNNVQIVRITTGSNTTTYNQLNGPLSNNFFLLPDAIPNQRVFGHIQYLDGGVTRVYEGETRVNLIGNVSLALVVVLVP